MSSRRDFIRKGLLTATTVTVAAIAGKAEPKREKVKMLTPDGKLVAVDKAVLASAPKKKASNREILEWRALKG